MTNSFVYNVVIKYPITMPRCDMCKWWAQRGTLDEGSCNIHLTSSSRAKMWADMYDGINTKADFGCVQWEKR